MYMCIVAYKYEIFTNDQDCKKIHIILPGVRHRKMVCTQQQIIINFWIRTFFLGGGGRGEEGGGKGSLVEPAKEFFKSQVMQDLVCEFFHIFLFMAWCHKTLSLLFLVQDLFCRPAPSKSYKKKLLV